MKYYLAYGSNLNKEQMAYRCPGAEATGKTEIPDYELVFRRGYLTIEPKQGSTVPVGIWRITEEHEKALDRYEGYPKFYRKQMFRLPVNGYDHDGREYVIPYDFMAYVMREDYPLQVPSDSYFYTVMIGYKDFGLDRAPLIRAYEKVKWPEDE